MLVMPAMQGPQFSFWVGKICWRRDRLPTPVFLGSPCGSAGKESTCNAGDLSLIPELGRSPGEGKGYPLQQSGLENSTDCIVNGVAKSWDTTEPLSLSLSGGTERKGEEHRVGIRAGFPGGSAGKESTCNAGDLGLITGLRRSPGEGKSYPLPYSGLENSMTVQSMGLQRVGHD